MVFVGSEKTVLVPDQGRSKTGQQDRPGYCQLLHKLKSSPVVNLKPSASEPQLLRLAAGQVENGGSGITRKHLASIASRLKTRVKF
ncbi:hypothetical protein KSS87_016702 [Heliosperma pusillum]|nr:hypothetical protein KSS87_016702 [Heliosperma pusillum]